MNNNANLPEKIVLGAINSLGYEIITDANVGIPIYMALAICCEASEPALSNIWLVTHENLYKDVAISVGVGALISGAGLVYISTVNYVSDMINSSYNYIINNV